MRRKNTTSQMMKSYMAQSLFLLMEKKGLSDISISQIADRAGVNRATYYRHFASKEHIIKYYYTGILSEYVNTLPPSEGVNLENYLHGMFTHLKKYEKQLLLIYKNGASYLIFDALKELFLQKQPPASFDDEFRAAFHTGGVYGTFLLWFSHGMKESPEEMCRASMMVLPNQFLPMLLGESV